MIPIVMTRQQSKLFFFFPIGFILANHTFVSHIWAGQWCYSVSLGTSLNLLHNCSFQPVEISQKGLIPIVNLKIQG